MGTILLEVPERKDAGAVRYARLSSADERADLGGQVARLAAFAAEKGIRVAKVVAEVGSGLSGQRKGSLSVLRSPEWVLIVEHRDRLVRLGSAYAEDSVGRVRTGDSWWWSWTR